MDKFSLVTFCLQSGNPRSSVENLLREMPNALPEVLALKGVMQTPDHHPEGDAFEHTMRVVSNLQKGADERLCMAALLHDVGKVSTQVVKPNGNLAFPGHARVGADMSRVVLTRFGFDKQFQDDVYSLVDQHMKFFDVMKMRPSKLLTFVSQPLFPLLHELHRLDKLGGSGDMQYYEYCVGYSLA